MVSGDPSVLRVTTIVFKSQGLAGFLSPAIGQLSELKEISLPNNQIADRIPPQIGDCRKLEILNLHNNQLTGEVPMELSRLVRLRVLDLSSNKLSGRLDFLKYLPDLEILSLSGNMFSGEVPVSVRSFRNLRIFNVSGNDILERSPSETEEKTLSFPKRYILAENTTRNGSTAAAPPPKNQHRSNTTTAKAPSQPSTTDKHNKHKRKRKAMYWVLGFLVGGLAGVASGLVFSVMYKLLLILAKGGPKYSKGLAIFSPVIKKAEDLAFLEKEGVASLELIGKGGCGEVYKAELPGSDGKLIAIKKIIQPQKDAAELTDEDSKLLNKKMRQIKSEIQTVGQIRHKNLLPLLAHVSRPDCHYLVYELMKNGSLQDLLQKVSEGKAELEWLVRHKIALGIASGLEYLHMNHSPRIIHRDLKPANILLDDDMEARIADFGLATAIPNAETHVTASMVAGTVGYIAPEYHQTLKFSDKCDIYSFGVILGVLVIGKLPSDEFFQNTDEMSIVKWMRNVMISEKPSSAIDPNLVEKGFDEQMLLVLKIACFCTQDDPKQRPNSKDVRCMLSQIKH